MADEITMKAINLLRDQDPNMDEINSMDKFLAHQKEIVRMTEQYATYSDHPQAEQLKERLNVLTESMMAFTYVYTQMMGYKREKLLADAREMEMASAVIELKQELDILTKINEK
jgi:hypothetical protein